MKFDVAHSIIAGSPALIQLSGDISRESFCPEGFIVIGVPIGLIPLYGVLWVKHVGTS